MGVGDGFCIVCACVCMGVHVFLCVSRVFLWVRIWQAAFIVNLSFLSFCWSFNVSQCANVIIALHEKRKELPTNKKDTDRGGNKDKRNKRGFQDTPALI